MVGPLMGGLQCRMSNLRNGNVPCPDIVDTFPSGLPKGGIFPRVLNYLSGPNFAHMSKVRNMDQEWDWVLFQLQMRDIKTGIVY